MEIFAYKGFRVLFPRGRRESFKRAEIIITVKLSTILSFKKSNDFHLKSENIF